METNFLFKPLRNSFQEQTDYLELLRHQGAAAETAAGIGELVFFRKVVYKLSRLYAKTQPLHENLLPPLSQPQIFD